MSATPAPTPPMPSPLRLITTLGLIAMLSGFTIVLIHQVTLEPIARNHRQALEQAVFHVLPGAVSQVNFRRANDALERLADDDLENANVFAGFDAAGDLVGVALQASARGYAGEVRVLYGYSPDRQTVIGFKVLQSSETPGLGDKIETDPRFLANFDALDVQVADDGTALVHPVVAVKEGQKTQPWQIDGITGATVSSFAVGRALQDGTAAQVPVIYAHRDQLTMSLAEERE